MAALKSEGSRGNGEVQPGEFSRHGEDGRVVGPGRFLFLVEPADEVIRAVAPELGQPSPAPGIPRDPLEAGAAAPAARVLLILCVGAWTQIQASVVQAVLV